MVGARMAASHHLSENIQHLFCMLSGKVRFQAISVPKSLPFFSWLHALHKQMGTPKRLSKEIREKEVYIYCSNASHFAVRRVPIRNIWSLEPGECIVAEEIMKRLKCEVYFPMRDVGLDLLVVKGDKHLGIQVKESRYYTNRRSKSGHVGYSWHEIKKAKFDKSRGKVNFYVFLTYLPVAEQHKISRFENKFLIIPSTELEKRMTIKDPGKMGVYRFYFHFQGSNVWDERVTVSINSELANYSKFLDAWHLIEQALK